MNIHEYQAKAVLREFGAPVSRGVAVLMEAEHLCMSMRGVSKPGAKTLTLRFNGVFQDDPAEQARFLMLARGLNAA